MSESDPVSQNEYPMDIGDYWAMLMRRKWNFLVPVGVILALAVALAFLLPPVYRSEATILIERQSIPQDLVATTVTGYVEEQIQQMVQRITTRDTLLEIASTHSLYRDANVNPGVVARQVQENIEVEMLDVRASDPGRRAAPGSVATIAFTVAFNANTAKAAQEVTQDLAQRFLDTQRLTRGAQAAQVSDFLQAETDALKTEIAELEGRLAGFKQSELRQLPELMGMNLQLFERTEQNIEQTEERIRGLRDSINALRSELSLTQPYREVVNEAGERVLNAQERLNLLTSNYMQATSRYSAEHPDVQRLRREIRILAEQTGNAGRADEMMNQLVNLQEELRQARQRYSASHPEVLQLERSVGALQRGFQAALTTPNSDSSAFTTPPDNPRYVAIKSQLDAAESNLSAETQKLADLTTRLADYEERLFSTPAVERDFRSLSRGYEEALRKFAELNDKQLQARMAESLESGDSAARWVLVSPAFLPSMPESPNRIGILLLGGLLAFGIGIGMVALAEYQDQTVRSARVIANIFGTPPLAVIPRMENGYSR